ncbi:MAG: amidase [Nocardioides sp.]|nr:amidase [Nocardioides sp.]
MRTLDPTVLAPDGRVRVEPTGAGALDGLDVVVKDLLDVAGRVTAAGNPTLAAGPPATAHAEAVRRVLAAGATVVGKVATDELAMGMFGVNSHFGTPPNPAAPDRVPGGSSSGSASAVAAGAADLGLGTDTGGSIRVPAGFCGLVGLRPTHGRTPLVGVRPMAPGFDCVGVLARTVDVARRGASVLLDDWAPGATRPVSTVVLLTDLAARADDEVAALARGAANRWAAWLGLRVEEEPLLLDGLPEQLVGTFWPLMSRQLWQSNGAWERDEQPVLGAGIAERIRAAADVADSAVTEAETARAALVERLRGLLDRGAVAVLPTSVGSAPRRNLPHEALMAYRDRNLPQVVPASLTGAPQLSLPAGQVDGAPAGVSLLGLPGDDELLLDLAAGLAASGQGPA